MLHCVLLESQTCIAVYMRPDTAIYICTHRGSCVEVLGAWLTARPYIRTLVKKKNASNFQGLQTTPNAQRTRVYAQSKPKPIAEYTGKESSRVRLRVRATLGAVRKDSHSATRGIFFFSMYAHTYIHTHIENYVPAFIYTYCLARASVDLWLNRH
jgi:hypothetical protein